MTILTACHAEQGAIFACAQAGCRQCLEYLLERHKGLVHACIHREEPGGVGYAEVAGEGRIGLWRAILRYDAERGVAFSTFAWRFIQGRVRRYAEEFRRRDEELAEDELADPAGGVEAAWQQAQISEALGEALESLPERLRGVIEQAYGLNGQGAHSLSEIGREMGLTGERVRQLRNNGLALLRLPMVSVKVRSLSGVDSRKDYREARRQSNAWQRQRRGRA
jgi:RNA polymerase sigma factor (sigma-70 family)